MLHPSEMALVERDPWLPALAFLLDTERLSSVLSQRTGVAYRVLPRWLRYKPGTSCVLAFDLESVHGTCGNAFPCMAKAYRTPDGKLDKHLERIAADTVITVDQPRGLLVTTLAGDRRLRAVAQLMDSTSRAAVLEQVLPGRGEALTGAALSTLRHNPERRWVGLVEPLTGDPIVLRAFRGSAVKKHEPAYKRAIDEPPRTPQLLGVSRQYGILAVPWAQGITLSHAPDNLPGFHDAGLALAQLHNGKRPHLGWIRPKSEATAVIEAAHQLATLLPALAAEAQDVAEGLAARLRRTNLCTSLVHGDFSADQVVVGVQGSAALIDMDSAAIGNPATDLGCAWAAAFSEARTDEDEALARQSMESLYAGYDSVRPLPSAAELSLFGAAHLVRRASTPFRSRSANWPDQTRRTLARASSEINSALNSRGALW